MYLHYLGSVQKPIDEIHFSESFTETDEVMNGRGRKHADLHRIKFITLLG